MKTDSFEKGLASNLKSQLCFAIFNQMLISNAIFASLVVASVVAVVVVSGFTPDRRIVLRDDDLEDEHHHLSDECVGLVSTQVS